MGTLVARSKKEFQAILDKLSATEFRRPLSITVQRWHPTATQGQRVEYFKLVAHIAAETGDDRQSVHHDLRAKFLGTRFAPSDGGYIEVTRSTKTLDAQEFRDYYAQCLAFSASFLTKPFGG